MRRGNLLIGLFLFVFLMGSVNALICTSWTDPVAPLCSDNVDVCAKINTSSLNFIKISCSTTTTQINKTFTILSPTKTYCSTLSSTTIAPYHGLEVKCIIESNENQTFYETINFTYSCPPLPPPPTPICGDGLINQANETCDDALNNGVTCSPLYGGSCTYCSNQCTLETLYGNTCGDGILDIPQEDCDDSSLNGILCSAGYASFCNYCSSGCTQETIQGSYCGDGTCDTLYENSTTCLVDCPQPIIKTDDDCCCSSPNFFDSAMIPERKIISSNFALQEEPVILNQTFNQNEDNLFLVLLAIVLALLIIFVLLIIFRVRR